MPQYLNLKGQYAKFKSLILNIRWFKIQISIQFKYCILQSALKVAIGNGLINAYNIYKQMEKV